MVHTNRPLLLAISLAVALVTSEHAGDPKWVAALHSAQEPGDTEATAGHNVGAPIPDEWYDIPSSPVAAELALLGDRYWPVLVNRSNRTIRGIEVGCIRRRGNAVESGYALFGLWIGHGGRPPGAIWPEAFNKPENGLVTWGPERLRCDDGDRVGVILVSFVDGPRWEANGAEWRE